MMFFRCWLKVVRLCIWRLLLVSWGRMKWVIRVVVSILESVYKLSWVRLGKFEKSSVLKL